MLRDMVRMPQPRGAAAAPFRVPWHGKHLPSDNLPKVDTAVDWEQWNAQQNDATRTSGKGHFGQGRAPGKWHHPQQQCAQPQQNSAQQLQAANSVEQPMQMMQQIQDGQRIVVPPIQEAAARHAPRRARRRVGGQPSTRRWRRSGRAQHDLFERVHERLRRHAQPPKSCEGPSRSGRLPRIRWHPCGHPRLA